jgi:diguanylate cyclase (GGDEF)-like protein/PAS domain S-box-containing protein
MNEPSPLESGCFNLLTDALESILVTPDQPDMVCGHICEQVRKITGAKAVMLLEGETTGEVRSMAVHPPTWKSRIEVDSARGLLNLALQAAVVSFWHTDDRNDQIAAALTALKIPNALVVPLLDGSSQIGSLLALGVDLPDEPEVLTRAMQPLSKVLGLLVQSTLLQQESVTALSVDKVPLTPSQDDSRAIFDAVNDAILVHEVATGAILDVNQRMCEMFGITYDEALWMDMGSLSVGLSPCTQDDAWVWMRKVAEEGPQNFEWIAKHKSGRLFWIEINMRLANIGGKERLLSTARDITDRKRTDAEQASRLKRSEAQNAVFLALAGVGLNYETALELIAHHLAIQVGDLCVLNILDEPEGLLRAAAIDQPYIDGRPLLPDYKTLSPFPIGTPGAGAVAQRGEAIQLTDPSGEKILPLVRKDFHPYLEHFGVHGLLVVPMRSQGKVIGTITLARCGSTKPYSAEDAAMLQNLADRSALTLVNARLYTENLHQAELLRQANAELEQRVAERTAELEKAMEALHRLAVEDTLTGIANRRRFNDVMDDEIRRARRGQAPLSLIMCDVDFFKRYNDHYGHQGGDDCLRMVGAVMREVFKRAGDLPARYGGEEFAAVLPGLNAEQAMCMGEKLRQTLADRAMPHKGSDVAPFVTLSIGTATTTEWTDDINADWFIARADEALYKSKANGRNRVTRG